MFFKKRIHMKNLVILFFINCFSSFSAELDVHDLYIAERVKGSLNPLKNKFAFLPNTPLYLSS